jgi:hypothetical protein
VCTESENVLVAEHKSELKALVMSSCISWIVCELGVGDV